MNLNPGGVIGGLAGAGVGIALIMNAEGEGGRVGRALAGCVTVGAFGGNFIWGKVFPPKASLNAKASDPDGAEE